MAHTRQLSSKMVDASANKRKVFECLSIALRENGLKPEEVVDLTPGPETLKGAAAKFFQDARVIGSYVSKWGAKCFVLPTVTAILDSSEKTLFDLYCNA